MHSIQFIGGGVDFHVSNQFSDFMFFCGKGHCLKDIKYIQYIDEYHSCCLEEKSYTCVADIVRPLYAWIPVLSQYEL
jgi:hypothetical protein